MSTKSNFEGYLLPIPAMHPSAPTPYRQNRQIDKKPGSRVNAGFQLSMPKSTKIDKKPTDGPLGIFVDFCREHVDKFNPMIRNGKRVFVDFVDTVRRVYGESPTVGSMHHIHHLNGCALPIDYRNALYAIYVLPSDCFYSIK